MTKAEQIEALIAQELSRAPDASREDILLDALELKKNQSEYEEARLIAGIEAYERGDWVSGEEFEKRSAAYLAKLRAAKTAAE